VEATNQEPNTGEVVSTAQSRVYESPRIVFKGSMDAHADICPSHDPTNANYKS
jgi:hypothetical protein